MDIVKAVLEKERVDQAQYKSILVEKAQEVNIDVGHLLAFDANELNEARLTNADYLLELNRDNTQLIINEIWKLQTEKDEEQIVAKLPAPSLKLPRCRKMPEPKSLTRWEKFAQAKGITKKKKDKKVWDETLGDWIPTYGFKRAKAEKEKDWLLEVPKNIDPMTDMFEKKKNLKQEKVARNEINRMKNIARAQKIRVPRAGIVSAESATSKDLLVATTIARASTASIGRFQAKLSKEKDARGIRELIPGMKRKRSVVDAKQEKQSNLELISSILKKGPKIDTEKAISQKKMEVRKERESTKNSEENERGKKRKRSNVGSTKKPRGRNGQRKPPGKKGLAGRKRR